MEVSVICQEKLLEQPKFPGSNILGDRSLVQDSSPREEASDTEGDAGALQGGAFFRFCGGFRRLRAGPLMVVPRPEERQKQPAAVVPSSVRFGVGAEGILNLPASTGKHTGMVTPSIRKKHITLAERNRMERTTPRNQSLKATEKEKQHAEKRVGTGVSSHLIMGFSPGIQKKRKDYNPHTSLSSACSRCSSNGFGVSAVAVCSLSLAVSSRPSASLFLACSSCCSLYSKDALRKFHATATSAFCWRS